MIALEHTGKGNTLAVHTQGPNNIKCRTACNMPLDVHAMKCTLILVTSFAGLLYWHALAGFQVNQNM